MNLEEITKQVSILCNKTGAYIRHEVSRVRGESVELKGRHNFVTYVDRNAEEQIVRELSRILPGSGIYAEEGTHIKGQGGFQWVIDPLDGTTNFIHRIPVYSISIALMKEKELLMGVVYEINREECFYGWKGGGAWLNGERVSVSAARDLDESLLATGFPYTDYGRLDQYIDLFKDLLVKTQGIRRLGSAALDLAYVACGRFEGFYEYALNPWDVAAGALLVTEAGGRITDFRGGDDYIFGKEIVSSNAIIHEELLLSIRKYFGTKPE
jgi:myo-inositol-1(or 4)-monophosphatase